MDRVWITNGSTSVAPVVNPLNAACHDGYLPTDVFVLSNPEIDHVTDEAATMMKTIVTAAGGEEPTIDVETIDHERDFDAIAEYLKAAIDAGDAADADVAIDVTPGRKFWSILGFRAGHKYGVDHVYYAHIRTEEYYGTPFPNVPRTALDLVDFTEVF